MVIVKRADLPEKLVLGASGRTTARLSPNSAIPSRKHIRQPMQKLLRVLTWESWLQTSTAFAGRHNV